MNSFKTFLHTKTAKIFFALLITFTLQSTLAFAKPIINVPDSVKQGNAVIVEFYDDEPSYDKVFVHWLDMKIPLYLEEQDKAVKGQILLAMPTDGTKSQKIIVQYGENTFTKNVKPTLVDWRKTTLTVEQKYLTPPKEVQEQIDANRAKNAKVYASRTMANSLALPLTRSIDSKMTSEFGVKRVYNGSTKSVHRGTDFRAAVGAKLHAVAKGVVRVAELQYYSGNVVMIDHGQGMITSYAHMSEIKVQEGQEVEAGDFIGYAGATGRVTGPHLHLSLILQGYSIDIEPLLAPSKMKKASTKKAAVKKQAQPKKAPVAKKVTQEKAKQEKIAQPQKPIKQKLILAPEVSLVPSKNATK